MKTQLVLQFKTEGGLDTFDQLVRFEDALSVLVGRAAHVDGHDSGSGEVNVFVLTNDPLATFDLVQQTDDAIRPGKNMKAAYRPLDEETYICLWPPELREFRIA